MRVSNTESWSRDLYAAGARSFSIRDESGNIVYDSGDILDKEANALGIYDDGRSRDKGVEPEGVTLLKIGDRTYAFVGLERTLKSAVAVFDVTEPANSSFVNMIVTDGDISTEGLAAYQYHGNFYLAIANEVSRKPRRFISLIGRCQNLQIEPGSVTVVIPTVLPKPVSMRIAPSSGAFLLALHWPFKSARYKALQSFS